ncbi:MAG: hypothetical protein EVA44_02505 [Flavobacteriales bacterium]|nr:MAG: hypothetical protein EVA44_02505 [Flavobacteriales bacterium]
MHRFLSGYFIIVLLISAISCKGDINDISSGNDPNFTIISHSDQGFSSTNRKVNVFGIDIYAVPEVNDSKLLHAANVLAQYLDNNEDGNVDNTIVHNMMIENKAFIIMWKNDNDLDIDPPNDRIGQDLGDDETNPNFVINNKQGQFDASLEEIWHIISHSGYAYAYPEVFGENPGTSLSNAMDIARGGFFIQIPDSYPSNAWYSYYDYTCEYDCMAAEYIYWAITSILGAQENRLDEIGDEWILNTAELVETTDTAIYSLLTADEYNFPTELPDGTYRH